MNKPIALSTIRLIKVEAPGYTAPTKEYKSKVEMKNELYDSRLFLLDVYESSTKDDFVKNHSNTRFSGKCH